MNERIFIEKEKRDNGSVIDKTYVSKDTKIYNNAKVSKSEIGPDCTIGDNVTFGVNSAVLPGTVIGSNTEIAINTYPPRVVKENSTILTEPGKNIGTIFNKNFR